MNKTLISKTTINRPPSATHVINQSFAAKPASSRPCLAKPAPTWVELLGER